MPKQTVFQIQSASGAALDVTANVWDTFGTGSTQKAVTATESQIVSNSTAIRQVSVKNIGTDTVYLGPTGLSDTDAPIVIAAGEGYAFDAFQGDLYAICAAGGSSTVAVLVGTV
jgi:hypothetical protein